MRLVMGNDFGDPDVTNPYHTGLSRCPFDKYVRVCEHKNHRFVGYKLARKQVYCASYPQTRFG